MTRRQLRREINQKLSMILLQARADRGESLCKVAGALSLSIFAMRRIELKPAAVPICILCEVIEYYGFDTMEKASRIFLEIQLIEIQYRLRRSGIKRFIDCLQLEIKYVWRRVLSGLSDIIRRDL